VPSLLAEDLLQPIGLHIHRLHHVQHNADASPKYEEVGPEMFCNDPETGKVDGH
jgi:hypothetical protein